MIDGFLDEIAIFYKNFLEKKTWKICVRKCEIFFIFQQTFKKLISL